MLKSQQQIKFIHNDLKKAQFNHLLNINHKTWFYRNFRVKRLYRRRKKTFQGILRLKYLNQNVESRTNICAYTIISKEFFNSPYITTAKPFFFSYKINKFIKNFF